MLKKVWKHKFFVSVAWTETGVARGVHVRLAWVLALFFGISGALGGYIYNLRNTQGEGIYLTHRAEAAEMRAHESEMDALKKEKEYQERQFQVFAQELGVLQARLERFDAIGQKLFDDGEVGKYLEELKEVEGKGAVTPPKTREKISLQELHGRMESLSEKASEVEISLQAGLELIARSHINNLQQPYTWPVVHERTYRSSKFGWRKDPFSGKNDWHAGVDLAGGYNAPIVSSAAGVVVFSGYRYGYGIMVEIRHAGGYSTRYGHLNKAVAKNGEAVKPGDLIGLMGSTGRSTGPHLHFEVLIDDHKVNPYPFIRSGREAARSLAKSGVLQEAALAARGSKS